MRSLHTSREICLAEAEPLGKICSEQGQLTVTRVDSDRQHGSEADNVIAPEHSFDLGEVYFIEVSAVAGGLEIHPSDFYIQRVFLGGHYKVRAIAPQFAVDLVADIGGDANHCRGYTYAKCDGGAG